MAIHHGSVRLPYASLEASVSRSTEQTGHDGGTLGKGANKNLINGANVLSTNGIERDFANEVNDRLPKSNIDQAIAVIGMALRFPQDATSPEKFWEMLVDGRSARSEVPKERYNINSHYRRDPGIPETVNITGSNELKYVIS